MTPERWAQLNQLFHAALEREPGVRSSFLAQSCAGDEPLRSEVESLLASHVEAEGFIETPASDVAAELFARDQANSLVGQSIGHYEIEALLGAGGMGEVYLAQDNSLGRRIAVKLLPRIYTLDADRVTRFELEARAASALNHPNIVTIHEIGRSNSSHFIATEFIDGETLRQHMTGRPLTLTEVLDIAIQVASALEAAHSAGIVHRDIKPENIMLRRDGFVKVLDFGLAKLALQEMASISTEAPAKSMVNTDPGMVMGTVHYMSPEQARGKDVDARTDIWSLGIVLFEMITGRVPFEGETRSHVVAAILESEPPPILHSDLPAELERIVCKALLKTLDERYQTAGALALDLKNLKQELEVGALLKRSLPDANGGKTQRFALKTASATAKQAADVAGTRWRLSGAYPVGENKRQRSAPLVATVILSAVAVFAYFNLARNDPPATPGEVIDSVAVLPFVNEGGDPNTEYLSDGISHSIINSLSQLPNLKVISLNSVLRYKGQEVDPRSVGNELNVRAVLVGRMTQWGDGLTISAELVDVRDNSRLWGEQYNRKLSDIFAVEKEIASEITEKLRLSLGSTDKQKLTKQYTESTAAYHDYLKGRYLLDKRTRATTEKSIEYFEHALKLDSKYAVAYAGLATAYFSLTTLGARSPDEVVPKAKEAVAKALDIDDTLAEAHILLGNLRLNEWNWSEAEREFKLAMGFNPNSVTACGGYAGYLLRMRRFDESIAESKRMVELDPVSVLSNRNLAITFYYARQYDQAIEQCKKTLELDPNMVTVYGWLAMAYEHKGLYDEAIKADLQGYDSSGVGPDTTAALREAYAASGWRGYRQKELDLAQKQAKQSYVSPYWIATMYAQLGEKDHALAWLEKAYEQHDWLLTHLNPDPKFDDLRSDPRFKDLLRRMNLEP